MKKIAIIMCILMSGSIHAANELDVTIVDTGAADPAAGFTGMAGDRFTLTAEYTRKDDTKGKKKVKKEIYQWNPGYSQKTNCYYATNNPPSTTILNYSVSCTVFVEWTDGTTENGADGKVLGVSHYTGSVPLVIAPTARDVILR